MASTNFKLFDENKTNMMSDAEYNINTQRLNGVQAGIASSQLQNKTLYQTSLVSYALAQIMMQNGYDANDSAAVSAFVSNISDSLLQKVLDKSTSSEAQAGTVTNKWISPATMKAAALFLSGGTMSGIINMKNNKITNLADPTADSDAVNKKYVDGKNKIVYGTYNGNDSTFRAEVNLGFRPKFVFACSNSSQFASYAGSAVFSIAIDGIDNTLCYIEITDTGFVATSSMARSANFGSSYQYSPYRYLAIG